MDVTQTQEPRPRKKYKRVKKVAESCNPLFEKWLKEWHDEAASKGWKKQYIYQKALASLKRYPLPITCGKDAKILEFFGDKICKMLDDKLKEHRMKSRVSTSDDDPETRIPSSTSYHLKNKLSFSSDSEQELSPKNTPTKQRGPRSREYVPVFRSGAYAILVTLFAHEEQMGQCSYLKKLQIMDAAQPHCEKSFRVAEPGKFHTAWASMGTLIKKGLIIKESSPAKYFLTDRGRELAKKLYEAKNNNNNILTSNSSSQVSQSSSSSNFVPFSGQGRKITDDDHFLSSTQSSTSSVPSFDIPLVSNSTFPFTKLSNSTSKKLEYFYITETGEEVREKSKAIVNIDDDMIGFLIKCKKDSLMESGKLFKIDNTRQAPSDYIYVFLHDNYAEEISPVNCSDAVSICDHNANELNKIPSPDYGDKNSVVCNIDFRIDSYDQGFVLLPDQFEVILCVDICESVTGAVNSRKLAVQNELRKNGIAFDIRKLNVGDFIWVAREKVSFVPGQLRLPRARELVLDYIVERKRMDDLAHSIKDGRFHEQKYRLKHCGLRKPIYLVEKMPGTTQYSLPESTLLQAIVNTEVVDGFTVKCTADQTSTVAYLTLMTRYLQSFFRNKVLKSCPYDRLPNAADSLASAYHLLTFEEFNSFSVKNKEITVREMFIKCLIQVRGLSVDKAVAIVQMYPTPANLFSAYEECESEKEKEQLVANIKYGRGQRSIGPKMSKILYQLYCSPILT